ncbi:MAG: hypothetical protein WCQ45_03890 [bacterium]
MNSASTNRTARGLHERLGFRVEKALPDVGLAVLRKPIRTVWGAMTSSLQATPIRDSKPALSSPA